MQPISADSHVVEGRDVFTGLADRFGDDAPRIMNVGDQVDAIVIPSRGMHGVSVARMGMAATRLARNEPLERKKGHKPDVANMSDPELVALFAKGYAGMRAGLIDGSKRYQDQDADGLAAEFLYPGFFGMFSLANTPLQVALQKNYNDWLHDHCSASNGRLYGLAAIPVQDPEAAASELKRVLDMGFRGGCIPCTSPPDTPYADPVYEPIWQMAEEAGFPLSMHVGTNAYVPPEYRGGKARRDAIADYAASQGTVQRTIVELMCRGVCDRHPNLKIVVAEFNAGWIAHWLDRVEQGLQRELRNTSEPYTGAHPHEIWKRQFYATIEDDRPALLTRELIGVDNLMWGSDYPHTDSTWPCSLDVLDELFADIDSTVRDKITADNVKQLYGL
jgi:predicted TIM-barrel fold metal-dependent hydrolase